MKSDDPEERIRQLERELAEVQAGVPRPPVVQSPLYDSGFAAPPRRTPGLWLVVVGAMILVPIGVLIAVLVNLLTSGGGAGRSGGSVGPVTVSQGGSLTLAGNGEDQTIACNDGSLTLSANNSVFNVTGHCASLKVTGFHDQVTVENSDAVVVAGYSDTISDRACNNGTLTLAGYNNDISVVGNCASLKSSNYGNRVRADSIETVTVSNYGNTLTLSGHCGSLTVSTYNNQVHVDTADKIDVSGYSNTVTYHSGSPKITQTGDGITVKQG
jgi:ribosomal protein L6P/L9E